uniref:Uncharacterized protein n=1 Tax=Setaria viridis TaxID=4556 RepID=A0A4U6SYZ8_SETVI|nr:hypothetical protein SEVIR_9G293450v2 [Setaria viridis]
MFCHCCTLHILEFLRYQQNHNLFLKHMIHAFLLVGADDTATLDKVMDSLTSLANAHGGDHDAGKETELALKIGNVNYCETGDTVDKRGPKIVDGIKNATASQLDVADSGSLSDLVSQVEVVVCLLPTSFHDGAPLAG